MKRILVGLLLIFLSVPAIANEQFSASLHAFVEINGVLQFDNGEGDVYPSGDSLLYKIVEAGVTDQEKILLQFQQKLSMSPAAADFLLAALLQNLPVSPDDIQNVSDDLIQSVQTDLLQAFRLAPDNDAILQQLGNFYGIWGPRLSDFPESMYRCLRATHKPAILVSATYGMQDQVGLLSHALQVAPDDLILLTRAAEETRYSGWSPSFYAKAYHLARERQDLDPKVSLYFVTQQLNSLLDLGLVHAAIHEFRQLPPSMQQSILNEKDERITMNPNDHSMEFDVQNIALDLGAAAYLAGDQKVFSAVLRSGVQLPRDPAFEEVRLARPAQRDLLRHLSESKTQDLFADLQTLIVRPGEEWSCPWDMLQIQLLEREEYYGAAVHYVKRTIRWMERATGRQTSSSDVVWPAGISSEAERWQQEVDGVIQALKKQGSIDQSMLPTKASDSMTPRIMSFLSQPPREFAEKPLPQEMKPLSTTDEQLDTLQSEWGKICGVVKPEQIVRLEQSDNRVVAIIESQRYDPMGEVSGGGYWILLSGDSGQTWPEFYYTGLRVMQPYVIQSTSSLPLFAEDDLRVEVEERQLDSDRITFPPIGLSFKKERQGIYLEIPFEALKQDSDADGLTDLTENALLLDAHSADTDGDGLADSEDPLPSVSFQGASDRVALAMAAVLASVSGEPVPRVLPAGSVAPQGLKKLQLKEEHAVFFIGDRDVFRGLFPSERTIVLTQDELDAAEKKRGPIYGYHLELFLLDQKQDRGIVVWDASWVGGTLLLEWTGDHWTVKEAGSWIT